MGFVIRPPQPDTLEELTDAPEQIIGVRKLCPCGKMFAPYRSYQRYDSDECRVKFESRRPSRYVRRAFVDRTCPVCGASFRTNDGKKVYCSNACYLAHEAARHAPTEGRACAVCGKVFTTTHWSKRYCGPECRREARRLR